MTKLWTLALDTSGDTFSLAIGRGSQVLAESLGGQPRQHLVQIFPTLELLCQQAGIRPGQLASVAVTSGPGSFTGLRTGLLLARTLGQTLDIPIQALDTLDVLAANAVEAPSVVAGLDARKSQVVWAHYRVQAGISQLLAPQRLESPEEFLAAVPSGSWLLGSIARACPGLAQRQDLKILPESLWRPRASAMLALALEQPGRAWNQIRPNYVRPADVQVHLSS